MKSLLLGLLVLGTFAGAANATKRPVVLDVGDDCDASAATRAVVASFRDSMRVSQRWADGDDKIPNTPEAFIKCWNVEGKAIVVTAFGFTVSGRKALFDRPHVYLAQSPENGQHLGVVLFDEWETFWRANPGP